MLTIVGVILAAAAAVRATPATLEQITAACIAYYSRGVPGLVTIEGQALCRGLVEAGVITLTPAQATALANAGFSVPTTVTPPSPTTPPTPPSPVFNQEAESSGEFTQAVAGEDSVGVDGTLTADIATDGPFTGAATTTVSGSVDGDSDGDTEVVLGQAGTVSAIIDQDVSAGALSLDQRFYDAADDSGVATADVGISTSNVDNDGGEGAASLVFIGTTTGGTGSQLVTGSAGIDSAVGDETEEGA